MKKLEKRLLSWLMVMAMVLSVVNISEPVEAKEQLVSDSKIDIGTPEKVDKNEECTIYRFNDTLNIEGTNIRSISVQFVSSALKGIEKIVYDKKASDEYDVELSSKTDGNWTHVMLNSTRKNGSEVLPLSAEEWKEILKKYFTIYVESARVRSIMVSVSEDVDFAHENLIEYNINNGHYYEVVDVDKKESHNVNWTTAREESLKATGMGPAYEAYLVNITSGDENAFVYTICRTTSWIGTTCDPDAKLNGSYNKDSDTITYGDTINDTYGYTLDESNYNRNNSAVACWFYVDGPEAGKLMTYGGAQRDGFEDGNAHTNTMKIARVGEKFNFGGKEIYGAYENGVHDVNNWANLGNWENENNLLYDADLIVDGNRNANEPNNCYYDQKTPRERYMVIYSKDDFDEYKWMIPSMWNDYSDNDSLVGSYIIEYSPKPGELPDDSKKQSIVELDGKDEKTIKGDNFSVIGKSGHLDVDDIVKKENGNVLVTVNGKEQKLNPEVSEEDINKLNDAIDKNEVDIVTVTVKDKDTGLEIPLYVTIVPKNIVALKSAETEPYRKEPGTEDKPGHYIAGEEVTLNNVTLNDGTVYTGAQLTNGNFSYQWQYAESDADTWKNIDGATSVKLSSKDTLKHAGDKVRLVITPSGDVKNLVADPDKKLYVDGDGYSDTDTDITGTYIDNYVIDASDFIVKLGDAKNMKDEGAITAAGAASEMNNKNGLADNKKVTDTDVEKTLNMVSAPGDVDVTFKSDWLDYSAKDKDDNTKTGKTVTAHVVNNEAEKEDDGKKYEIGANDITVSTTTAKTFENSDKNEDHEKILVNKAGVVVVSDGETVEELKPEKVRVKYDDKNPLKSEVGDYEVTYIYEYADGKTIEVKGKVKVVDPFFEVIPTNPNPKDPTDPTDGIEGPVEDTEKSKGNDYVYYIHLDNEVDNVNLNPDIVNADITGLTKKLESDDTATDIDPIPEGGKYTVDNVPTDDKVVVKYTVKSKVPGEDFGKIYTYTYIIDRAKSDDATIKDAEPGPGSTDNKKIIEITTDQPEYTWPIVLNDIKAIVESIDKKSGNGNLKYPDKETAPKDKFTVDNLKPDETTVVNVVTKAENGDKLTYEVRITNNKKSDNVNVETDTKDETPDDTSDDPKIEAPVGPKEDTIDGVKEDVKDITIIVPNKVKSLEVIPTREDPKSRFVTDFGKSGLKVYDGTTIDNTKSYVTAYDAKFIVNNLKVNADSKVAVKVVSEDGKKTCVYRYTIKREKSNNPDDGVKIETTADPVPENLEDKPVVDDKKDPEKVGDELVKKITITVPSSQSNVVVHTKPEEGKLDKTYDDDGIKIIDKPDTVTVTPDINNDADPKFTANNLSTDKDTVVSVKGVSDDGGNIVIYEYTIKRAKNDNVNVITNTKDETPTDPSDDPKIGEPSAPKDEDVDGDGNTEKVKDIKIIVPNNVDKLEVVPTREDSDASFDTAFGNSGIKVDAGTIDSDKSSVKPKEAKITVTNLKVDEPSVVLVKVNSADGNNTCIYRYTIEREDGNPTDDGVKINTTAEPDPANSEDKPVVDDSKAPEKVGDELVKKITITVPSSQEKVKVNPVPEEGMLDPKYNGSGLNIITKPTGVNIDNNIGALTPSFTVDKLQPGKDTVVAVKGVSDDGKNTVIYEYTIKRLDDDNVNVNTKTPDSTPDDSSDDPKVGEPEGPKSDTIDGNDEQVKDIKITVPNKVDSLLVVPTKEDPSAKFDTTFGTDGIKVADGTSIDKDNSSVTPKDAKFTVTELKTSEPSVVLVKVKSADGKKTCVYRYSIDREKSNDATIKGVDAAPGTTDDEKNVDIITDQPEYTWPIELNDPNATIESIDKVSGNGNLTVPDDKGSFTVKDLAPGETTVVKVVTKAENGDKLTYNVSITNNSGDPSLQQVSSSPVASGFAGDVKPEDITYEKTNPQDKIEPIDPAKKIATSAALKINGNTVPDNYVSVSPDGTKLIISRDYLATLEKGVYPAVLTYADGTVQEFKVSILDYDEKTLVKNPPLFSMYKEIVLKKKNTFTVNLKGISDYAKVTSKITGKGKKAKSVVKIKQQKNGDVLITPKKTGKTQVTCTIIQNGAEYKVVVDIKVLNQYKGTSKNFNLKSKGLVKTSGELPEFNVYKRIVRGKNTKIKFTKVATDAKVKFYVANKKEAKSLKIGKVKRKGKTATCTIVGKKKGWVHLTAEITQNGKTYYTRLLVRIDDGTWSNKQINKYLK